MKGKIAFALMIYFLLIFKSAGAESTEDCDYQVEIMLNGTKFSSYEFTFRMLATKNAGPSTLLSATASIEDDSGNTIRSYKPWNSQPIARKSTSRTYTPNLKPGNYKIIAEINVECNDILLSNNKATQFFEITGIVTEDKEDNNGDIADINPTTSTTTTTTTIIEKAEIEETKKENEKELITGKAIEPSPSTQKTAPPSTTSTTINIIKNIGEQKKNKLTVETKPQQTPQKQKQLAKQVIYEDSSVVAKKIALASLMVISVLLAVILIWKR